ncbi:helix-turn-helix transcriptional regulator [Rhizobium sp. BE258]|uniref:helix-turn-helix domain-containing protein n=1 Tax=Rhizobium sp. BE258 TaxID=2817722 RepID=UPI00285663BD|nr:helix-turn-helix transcriptional regulator [Rhizobium sp. BE258]MDR7145134.1 transcriptional regulator with XRE-family HTH domain [Rhizobium sp. BE258]
MLQKSSNATDIVPDKTADQHIVDIEIGKRVKKRRLQLRLSQTALGAAVGVSFQQVQKYERGTNRVSASTLYEMAMVLQVPITHFFDGLSKSQQTPDCELTKKAAAREEFVATGEGQRLVDAFLTIPKKMRPKFVSLLATFSSDV